MSPDGRRYRDDGDSMPANFGALVARHGTQEAIALEVFHSMDSLAPQLVPHVDNFSNPTAYSRWQKGAPMPEALVPEFAAYLAQLVARSGVIAENERRLRATTWAQWTLASHGKQDYADMLARFHREQWGIAEVCSDSAEREAQVQAVARNGQRRDVRHG